MSTLLTIGDFSRAVRMTSKALRFYHRNGLLAPAVVDERNGYRLYAPEQIADAQVIRTLRGLDVPVDAIRDVLSTPDVDARSRLMADHLARMERKLDQTRAAVDTLRAMLGQSSAPIDISHRREPETRVVAVRETIALEALDDWFPRSIETLTTLAADVDPQSIGPYGGMWPDELFARELGTATVYLTIRPGFDEGAVPADARIMDLPAVELAVAVHDGPDEMVPHVYAELGRHVAQHELSSDAPVRETYLTGFPRMDEHTITEIGWPVFRVAR